MVSIISTHDLARRSTPDFGKYQKGTKYFNSRPRKEVDACHCLDSAAIALIFQLTTSQGGRHHPEMGDLIAETFQLTTSQGGRLTVHIMQKRNLKFQLTTSQGGRPPALIFRHVSCDISTHDLARRSTLADAESYAREFYFNSRPRKEVDSCRAVATMEHRYFNSRPRKEVDSFATTVYPLIRHFNSRPRKEVDDQRALNSSSVIYFNSRPRKEVDL